jgi:hypothetical protein
MALHQQPNEQTLFRPQALVLLVDGSMLSSLER